MTHAEHKEPWHPDCPTCRAMTDPGIPDGEPWPVYAPKPRPRWRRLLDALRRMR